MKKLIVVMMALAMVFSLAACGGGDAGTGSASAGGSDSAATEDIYLTLVNKTHPLPENWEDNIELLEMKNAYDEDIRVEKTSYEAYLALRDALLEEGVDIELDSCYRSVERQEELWKEFEEKYGEDYCKKYVAVPGTSEHHTGFAIDVCLKKGDELIIENDDLMKEVEIWEKVHAMMPEYGFILRFPEGKEDVVGYAYEPWHMRYVGSPEVAKEITEKGLTLEEYLGEDEPDGSAYGYGGDDPTERAAYKYMVDVVSKSYDEADASIPTVSIFYTDYSNPEDVAVYGDFSIDNYKIDGDTLKSVSGGHYPGVMHMAQDGPNHYAVTKFDVVEDGGNFEESAKTLFGEYYEDFMKIYSDDDARQELRKITVTDYVNLNELDIKQFQDEGWDPVELYQ